MLAAEFIVSDGNFTEKSNAMVLENATGIEIADNTANVEEVCSDAAPEIGIGSIGNAFEAEEPIERMRLLPNPSNGTQVRAEVVVNENEVSRIEIFNLSGRRVAEELVNGTGMRSVILPPLARGIYLVRHTIGRSMDTQKLIVE